MKLQLITSKALLVLLMVLLALPTFAQEKPSRAYSAEELSEKRTSLMVEKLKLDKNEAEQLKAINLKYANKLNSLQEEGRSKTTREKLEKLNHEHNAEVKSVLSDEAFREFLVLKRRMHERMKMKMKEKRHESQRQARERHRESADVRKAYIEQLNLNEEQKKQLKAIKEKYKAQREAIRAEGRSKGNWKKLEALQKEQNAEVKEVLDEDQYKLYLEMQEKRKQNIKARKAKK